MQALNLKPTWPAGLSIPNCTHNDDISVNPLKPLPPRGAYRKSFKPHIVSSAVKTDESAKQMASHLSLGSNAEPTTVRAAFDAAVRALESAPVESFGTAAVVSGAAAMTMLMSAAVLSSMDAMPLVPQALQLLGVSASGWFATHYMSTKAGADIPASPIRALSQLLDRRPGGTSLDLSEIPDLDDLTRRKLKSLAEQRDTAVTELEDLKGTTDKMARLVAEKEALEAVAMQLAGERDEALGEVRALKTAVDAMTERMRAIEAMLAQEVGELRQQNQALETVALQLASERDSALSKVAELQKAAEQISRADAEKEAVQLVAARLAEERDCALADAKELRQVVASLRTESDSGLTPEAEVFLKSRLRDIRSLFVNVEKSYNEQPEAVEKLVSHLVNDYGAPRQWTMAYMKQFLEASAGRNRSLGGTGVPSLSSDRKAATNS